MTVDWFNDKGFNTPLLVDESEGLGLVVPPSDFTVADVERYVGKYMYMYSRCIAGEHFIWLFATKNFVSNVHVLYMYVWCSFPIKHSL